MQGTCAAWRAHRSIGVRAADLEAQRAALIEFAAEMYRPLARCDQRAKGEQYVRGLLLEGRRKSIQPMAARLPDGDEEGLQNFVTDSPWDDVPVRRRLARRMTAEIEPEGWIVDDTGLPKDGRFSPGVAHQYCGALGKTANCQVLVSVNAASDRASCPLQWRLFVPESWDQDQERRRRARIPEELRHVAKWQLALEIIDQLLEWGLARRVVQADGGYGDITAFRTGLEERELEYVVQVKGVTSAQPADAIPITPDLSGHAAPARPPLSREGLKSQEARAGRRPRAGPHGRLARGRPRPAGQPVHRAAGASRQRRPTRPGRGPARAVAAGRMARGEGRAGQVLARQPPA